MPKRAHTHGKSWKQTGRPSVGRRANHKQTDSGIPPSAKKTNGFSSRGKTWRNFKCRIPSERPQPCKVLEEEDYGDHERAVAAEG